MKNDIAHTVPRSPQAPLVDRDIPVGPEIRDSLRVPEGKTSRRLRIFKIEAANDGKSDDVRASERASSTHHQSL